MGSLIPTKSGTRLRRIWSNRNGIATSRSIFEVKPTLKHSPSSQCSYKDHLAKYEFRKFFNKHGVVAAILGPPKSRQASLRGLSPQPPSRTSTMRSTSSPAPKPTTQLSALQPTITPPPRPSSAIVQPTQTPVKPAVPRPASVWDDLASLSTSTSDASLPLQYAANPAPIQPIGQQPTSFNPMNPYANFAVTGGVQPQPSPLSQPFSLPLQQNPAMSLQTPGYNSGLQPSFGGTPGLLSTPQSQSTNLLAAQTQQFNTGGTLGAGLNNTQQPFSAPAFSNQTFLPQQTQSSQTQQFQQPGGGVFSATFPGQMQGFQQPTPSTTGNPFIAMQQQHLQQMQPTGYMPQQPQQQQPQQAFGMSPANPFNQMMQPGTQFTAAQTQGWQNGGFPTQQQPWG